MAISIHQNFMFLVMCAPDSVQLHPPVFADDGARINKEACFDDCFFTFGVLWGFFLALSTPVISKWQHQPTPCRE